MDPISGMVRALIVNKQQMIRIMNVKTQSVRKLVGFSKQWAEAGMPTYVALIPPTNV